MSRATASTPARVLAALAAGVVLATAAAFGLAAAPAQAAKPCWEKVLDDWVDNGRIDGVYPSKCLVAARRHVPEDIRAYSDFEDKIATALLRTPQGAGGSGTPSANTRRTQNAVNQVREPRTSGNEDGPIKDILTTAGPTEASSVPLPLIVLAVLALLLFAAGGAGFAARKLQARRAASGSS